jgi:hypothetical protein
MSMAAVKTAGAARRMSMSMSMAAVMAAVKTAGTAEEHEHGCWSC